MKSYLASLAVGLLVGVVYALFNVRSPAPPVIALLGLLGILLGEQIPPFVKQTLRPQKTSSWMQDPIEQHVQLERVTHASTANPGFGQGPDRPKVGGVRHPTSEN